MNISSKVNMWNSIEDNFAPQNTEKSPKTLTIGSMCSTFAKMSCSTRFLASLLLCTTIFGKFSTFDYLDFCQNRQIENTEKLEILLDGAYKKS